MTTVNKKHFPQAPVILHFWQCVRATGSQCLSFIRSGQNHLARDSERVKTRVRQTDKKVGRQHQGMDRPGVRQVPEGREEQRKMEETGCEVSCGAQTTPALRTGLA